MRLRRPDREAFFNDEVRFLLFLLLLLAAVWVDQARGASAWTESASVVRVSISRQ